MCDYTWGKADILHLSVDYSSAIIRESKVFLGLQKVRDSGPPLSFDRKFLHSVMDTELV